MECAGGHRNRVFLNSIIDPPAPVVIARFFLLINFLSVPCAVTEVRRHVGYRLFLFTVIPWPVHFLFSFLVLFLSVYLSPRSGQSKSWLSSVELFGTWRSIFVSNLLTLSTLKAPEKRTLSTQFQGTGRLRKERDWCLLLLKFKCSFKTFNNLTHHVFFYLQ